MRDDGITKSTSRSEYSVWLIPNRLGPEGDRDADDRLRSACRQQTLAILDTDPRHRVFISAGHLSRVPENRPIPGVFRVKMGPENQPCRHLLSPSGRFSPRGKMYVGERKKEGFGFDDLKRHVQALHTDRSFDDDTLKLGLYLAREAPRRTPWLKAIDCNTFCTRVRMRTH